MKVCCTPIYVPSTDPPAFSEQCSAGMTLRYNVIFALERGPDARTHVHITTQYHQHHLASVHTIMAIKVPTCLRDFTDREISTASQVGQKENNSTELETHRRMT